MLSIDEGLFFEYFFFFFFSFLTLACWLSSSSEEGKNSEKRKRYQLLVDAFLNSTHLVRTMADDEAAQLAAAAALPMRERAKSKLWKARVAAFEEIAKNSTTMTGAGGSGVDDEAGPKKRWRDAPCFSSLSCSPFFQTERKRRICAARRV